MDKLSQILEAILFVSGEPVATDELSRALNVSQLEAVVALEALQAMYDRDERGIELKRYGDHYKLETRAAYAPYVQRLLQPVQRQTLSQAAMETLAVVAYRQPVTRGEIEAIRGVKCDYSVQSLLNKGLIKEVGRKETLGHPTLLGTTDRFLEHFGIGDVRELPPLPEPMPPARDEEPLVP